MVSEKLLNSGYSVVDIQDMISLLQQSLTTYQGIFNAGSEQEILLALHKLKGGLRVLQFSYLLDDLESVELSIKASDVKSNISKLVTLIENCLITSEATLKQLDHS